MCVCPRASGAKKAANNAAATKVNNFAHPRESSSLLERRFFLRAR